ncbi:MAG: RIO1 family regulatory kinase/ATPase [Desulfobacteraceae bacterium]
MSKETVPESFIIHSGMEIVYANPAFCTLVGEKSEFNVLLDPLGPVIIDLPQAVDATANNNAQRMLVRDVDNMTAYYARFAPQLKNSQYASEIWALYDGGKLNPDRELTGLFEDTSGPADVGAVLDEIQEALAEEQERQRRAASASY